MTKATLEEEILLRGYEKEPEIIIPTQPIIELSHTLDDPFLEQLPIHQEKIKIGRNSTINFYETFFKLQRICCQRADCLHSG